MANNKQIKRHRSNRLSIDDLYYKEQKVEPTKVINPNYRINFGMYKDRYVFNMKTKIEIDYLKWIISNKVQPDNKKLHQSIKFHLKSLVEQK